VVFTVTHDLLLQAGHWAYIDWSCFPGAVGLIMILCSRTSPISHISRCGSPNTTLKPYFHRKTLKMKWRSLSGNTVLMVVVSRK